MKFFNFLSNYFSNRETFQEIIVIPVIATLLAIFLGLLLLIVSGSSNEIALKALIALFYGSFGSLSAISETLTAATPLIFAALGIAVGFRAGLFNIGAEGRITIMDLFNVINKHLNLDMNPILGPNRPGDIPHSNASILKATKMLDYRPEYNFDDGIKKTIDYFLNL